MPVLVHRGGAESGVRRVVSSVAQEDFTPSGRRTLDLTLLIAERLAETLGVEWTILTPADAPVIAETDDRLQRPTIIVDERPPHAALADIVAPSDLVVVGVPRALDGLGSGVARIGRSAPGSQILAIAAR